MAPRVAVSNRQREILQGWVRARKTAQRLVERARIVLMSAEGMENRAQARALGVDEQRPGRWRRRWAAAQKQLAAAEDKGVTDKDLEQLVRGALSDKHRPGSPPRFGPEQVTDIIALACEAPSDSGLPISHWTPSDLAREAIKRGIVDSISPRQVDRFLKRSRPQAAQDPLLAHIA
jgi:hypothetical protein